MNPLPEYNNSVLLFDKPLHWTSYDVVNKVKRIIHCKTGHAGTLDPLASGLLILCTGSKTKDISDFQVLEKEYTGTIILGAGTPSHDLETEISQRFDTSHIDEKMIEEIANTFIGEKLQSPPVYSAKQIAGRRSYEYAREGTEVEVRKNLVTLYSFGITRIALPEVEFRIVCGKGFYVRSLAHDFGKALNSAAHLSTLCRTRIGRYDLKDAWQIDAFAKFVAQKSHVIQS